MALKGAAGVLISAVVLLGAEAVFALRKEFIREGPEGTLSGEFGDPSNPQLSFAVMGDSTSVGLGAESKEQTFPWLLSTWLAESFHVKLTVLGRSGHRMTDVANEQLDKAVRLKPDLVLIEVGANDATHATGLKGLGENMAKTLNRLKEAGITVVVAGPPHMGTSRAFAEPLRSISGWSGKRIERVIEEEVRKREIDYIDLSAATAEQFKTDPNRYYSKDFFHPGAGGYKLWADTMYPTILKSAEGLAKKQR